ncbi:MAG: acyl dehydratase [Betaproteobacteria bacterium]|nr:acyl dehydratase [Betaproteobacteria bacterium]
METVGIGKYFEDLPLGLKFRTIGRTVTESDIINVINATGMLEVLFTNTEYLKHESVIKGRLVPAILVLGFAEGQLMQTVLQKTGLAFLDMEMKVHGPTFAGDTIHVEVEVIESRATSKPDRGLVRTRNSVFTQAGTKVLEYTPLRMVKRKG